jgi:hypothetical protein
MKGDDPRFKATYAHEELVEHFLLSPGEQVLIDTCRVMGIGMAWRSCSKPSRTSALFLTKVVRCLRTSRPL